MSGISCRGLFAGAMAGAAFFAALPSSILADEHVKMLEFSVSPELVKNLVQSKAAWDDADRSNINASGKENVNVSLEALKRAEISLQRVEGQVLEVYNNFMTDLSGRGPVAVLLYSAAYPEDLEALNIFHDLSSQCASGSVFVSADVEKFPVIAAVYADGEGQTAELQVIRNGLIHSSHFGDMSERALNEYLETAMPECFGAQIVESPNLQKG